MVAEVKQGAKKKSFCRNIGQSTVEYAVLLAIVASALIGMQVYLKRGLQGRVKDLADQISPQHYEQGWTSSNYTTTQSGATVNVYEKGIAKTYQGAGHPDSRPETVTRSGNETVSPDYQR